MAVLLLTFAAGVWAQSPDDGPFVLEAPRYSASAATPGGTVKIALTWNIEKGAYLYRDQLSIQPLRPQDFADLKVDIPAGVEHSDSLTPQPRQVFFDKLRVIATVRLSETVGPGVLKSQLQVAWQGCGEIGGQAVCYPPERRKVDVEIPVVADARQVKPLYPEIFSTPTPEPLPSATTSPAAPAGPGDGSELPASLLAAVALAFVGGVLTSFTPCVYPLIPVILAVVGIETGQTQRLKGMSRLHGAVLSLTYVTGIVLMYAILGGAAAWVGDRVLIDPQNVWARGIAAAIFLALAASMFGLFNLQLPSALTSRLRVQGGGGILGAFIAGVASSLVATTCVAAPLLAALTFAATSRSVLAGVLVGGAFAAGMGLLLVVVGTFAELIQRWSSGAWMVSVKRAMGFILVGAAVYFLQPVLPATAWRLAIGTFLVIAGVFAGGLDRLESGSGAWLRTAKSLGLLLILAGAVLVAATVAGWAGYSPVGSEAAGGIDWYHSVEDGLAAARAQGKPAIIDFWASWCPECLVMDVHVFSSPEVIRRSRQFVMIRADITVDDATSRALKRRFDVPAPPTLVFIAPDGTQETLPGALNKDQMLAKMQQLP